MLLKCTHCTFNISFSELISDHERRVSAEENVYMPEKITSLLGE